jgi:hypothetical protein
LYRREKVGEKKNVEMGDLNTDILERAKEQQGDRAGKGRAS